ncbi:diguanylate cyclase [Vibrio lentus]|nr:diguanylate cyclase [Vibrio lentus]
MAQRSPYPLTNVGVIWLHIDHFQRVNDQYGHAQGDRVICRGRKIAKEICIIVVA